MASREPTAAVSRDPDKPVREHLQCIHASPTFKQVDRLKRFLSFIVLESIGGRRNELKEYVIGVHVFGKESTFDPRTDPIVRVQARRLRAKLVRYYQEEGRGDEVIIDLPKGGYAPVFKHREPTVVAKRSVSSALASRNTVSVAPFVNHGGGQDLDHFCLGVREEIIHHLARFHNLRILALEDAANRADAAMLVSGSVRASGTRLRIAVQLVDAASRCYLWSESIDADSADWFDAQERVARAIVQKLAPELGVGHAVDRVTDHRKVDRRQVNADLVRPAGLQPDREQRVLGEQTLDLEMRDRVARRVRVQGSPQRVVTVAADRRLDPAGP